MISIYFHNLYKNLYKNTNKKVHKNSLLSKNQFNLLAVTMQFETVAG